MSSSEDEINILIGDHQLNKFSIEKIGTSLETNGKIEIRLIIVTKIMLKNMILFRSTRIASLIDAGITNKVILT